MGVEAFMSCFGGCFVFWDGEESILHVYQRRKGVRE